VTREQRQRSQRDLEVRAAVDVFRENPCRLSPQQTRSILTELCAQLGYCLSPTALETVEADPPTDPQAFTELVMRLDGVGSADPGVVAPVLERVLRAFEGVARARAAVSLTTWTHCCEAMVRAVGTECEQHPDRSDCPDALLGYFEKFCEYGILVHDGGTSMCSIDFCPWCGARLPESQRDRWFDEIARLGFSGPDDPAIPERFQSDAWWRKD
jgi:hypothetical protein